MAPKKSIHRLLIGDIRNVYYSRKPCRACGSTSKIETDPSASRKCSGGLILMSGQKVSGSLIVDIVGMASFWILSFLVT